MQNPPPNPPNYGSSYGGTPPPTYGAGGGGGGKTSMGLDENVAAMLCYLTMPLCALGIIVSLIFFLVEKGSRFVRFHAMQSLLLVAAGIVINVVIRFIAATISSAMALGLQSIILLVFLILWVLCAVKAYQGQAYKVPVVGDVAENIAGK